MTFDLAVDLEDQIQGKRILNQDQDQRILVHLGKRVKIKIKGS